MLPPYGNPRHVPEVKECVQSLVSEVVKRGSSMRSEYAAHAPSEIASTMQNNGSATAAYVPVTSQISTSEKLDSRREEHYASNADEASVARAQTNLTAPSNRKVGLSMNPGAIRARERRRREKEEKLRKEQELKQSQHLGDIGSMHAGHGSTHGQLSGGVSGGGALGPTSTTSSSGYQSYASNYKATLHGSKAPQSIAQSSGPSSTGVSNVAGGNSAGGYRPTVGKRGVGRPALTGMPHETNGSQSKKTAVSHLPPKPFVPPLPPPLSSLEGDQTLAASILPPQFPNDESFRALSCYALLRTMSLPLRLSPFTPTAFLRSLSLPVISKLLGEIHVSILKFLFVDIGRGADFTHLASAQTSSLFDGKVSRPRHRGPSTDDGDGEGYMGSENLNYMDEFTWPLFYVDYVEATEGRFRSALETEQEGTYRGKVTGHETSVVMEVDEEAGGSTKNSSTDIKVDNAVKKARQRQSLLTSTLLDLVKQMKRRCDTYGFFSRPVDPIQDQCPDYFHVVDRHREAMDLGTMEDLIKTGVIFTFADFEIYLRRIVHCARKYNTDEENFVRVQTEKFDAKAIDLLKKTKSSFVADHGDDDDVVASKGNANSSDELLSAIQNKNPIVTNSHAVKVNVNDVNAAQNGEVEEDSDTSMEDDEPDDDDDNDQSDESEFSLTGDSDVDERPRKKRAKIDKSGKSTLNKEKQGGSVVGASASASPPVVKMEGHTSNEGHEPQQKQDEADKVGKGTVLATEVPSHAIEEKLRNIESESSCVVTSNEINVNREGGSSQALPVTSPSADLRENESVVKRNDGVQGVFSDINGKWCAKLTHGGELLNLGSFNSSAEASKMFEEEYTRIKGSTPPDFDGKVTADSGVDQNRPKRGRGRPRKTEAAPSETTLSSVEKKKRGRPPKSKFLLSHRKSKTSRSPFSMTPGTSRVRESRTKQDRSGKRRAQRNHSYARSHAPAEYTMVEDSDSDASVEEVSLKLPHILAAHEIQMQHSEQPRKCGYHKIPLKSKLDILQFLLEELLQMGVFTAEITRRHQITQCFWPASYLPLPSKQDLETLVNVDDCVVCNYPGNLVCCDGCTNSYHKRCVTTSEMWDLPPGKWLCPECTIVDSAKLGPLHGGSRAELSWWSHDDWKRLQDNLCKNEVNEETAALDSEPKGAQDDTNTDSKHVSPVFQDGGAKGVNNDHTGTKHISQNVQHAASKSLDGEVVGVTTAQNNSVEAKSGHTKDTMGTNTDANASETDAQKPTHGPGGESVVDETLSTSGILLEGKQHKMENEEKGKECEELQQYLRKNEFLVVHGFVFVRSKGLHREWQDGMQGAMSCTSVGSSKFSPPVPLGQGQLRALLLRLGPDVCIQWPWCQIPYDPYKIWPQFAKKSHSTSEGNQNQCIDNKLVEAFDVLRNKFLAYFSGRKRYDPTSYGNLYGRAPPAPLFLQYQPIPKHLIQFTTSNYEFLVSACMRTGILQMSSPVTCPVIHGMTRVMDDDAKLIESVRRCGRSADVLGPAKDYLVQLEKSLYKAYLLHEHWGLEETKNPEAALGVFAESGNTAPLRRQPVRHTAANRKWGDKLSNAKTVARVAKCAVELVDAIESRAFYDEWNWQPGQTAAPPSLQGKDRTYSDLASDWSPSQAMLRRKWERGDSLMESRRLLLGDAANAMEQTGKRIVTIGRKRGRKAQHRLVIMEPISAVSGLGVDLANTQGSGLSPGLPMASGLPRRKPRAPGSGGKTGRPTKLTRYYVKCAHCGEVPSVGIKANEPQLATNDLLMHLKGCPACPTDVLGLLCTLQSDGLGSSDSTAFFVTLLNRIRSFINNASIEDDMKDGTVAAEKSEKASVEKPWIVSVDQTNCDLVFDFEGSRYPLVRPEDKTAGSQFTIALYKHFTPSLDAAVGESSNDCTAKRAPTSRKRAKEANLRKGQVKDRYYVACVHCGHTPAHGIKIHGPQHATKDLFYHVRDCSMCPQQIKYLVAKLRGQGERSSDSAAFFRQQLQRIRAFLDNPPLAEEERQNDKATSCSADPHVSKDESNESHVFSFDASKYPLVRPEDQQMASKYFVALYKNYRPIVPTSGDHEGSSDKKCTGANEVTLDPSEHDKRIANVRNTDGNVGDGSDQGVRTNDDMMVCSDQVDRENSCHEISGKQKASDTDMAVGHDDKTKSIRNQASQMKPPIDKALKVQSVNDAAKMDQPVRGIDATNDKSKDGIVNDADEDRKAIEVEVAKDKKGLGGGTSAVSDTVHTKENDGKGIDERMASADETDSARMLTEPIAIDGAKGNNVVNLSGIGRGSVAKLSDKVGIENGRVEGGKKEDALSGQVDTKYEHPPKKSEQYSATGKAQSCEEENVVGTNSRSSKDKLSSPSEKAVDSTSKSGPAKDASSPGRGKKKRRKKPSRESASTKRRRSGRVQLRNAVHDEIGTFAIPVASTSSSAVARPATGTSKSTSGDAEPSKGAAITPQNAMDAELMMKERNARIAELEKLLAAPFEKEIHWPICGRKAFPPPGSLSPAILQHLGRNAGMKMAPFMQYSDKFEVGRSSVRHIWRTETLECGTVEDLYLQIRILAAHVNRPTIHSCETLGRRSNSAKSVVQKVIKCSHRDPATGMIEYFVVNRGKNRGCWLPEDTVDLSSFILMKSDRVQEAKRKDSARIAERKRKEEEKRRKAAAEAEEKRRKAAAEAEAKRRAAAEAEAKRRAEEAEATRRAVQEAEAKRRAAAEAEARQRAEMTAHWKPTNPVTASAANLPSATGSKGKKPASRGRGRPKGRRNKSSETEEQYVLAFQQAFNQHKLDTKQLLKDAADAGLKAVPVGKMSATRLRNREAMRASNEMLRKLGSKRTISEEDVIKKLSEAETIGVDMHVKAETVRLSGQPAAQTGSNGQSVNDSPSVDDFARAFHAAFYQHQVDTRQLLKDAADSGLDTVPTDKMSQVRMKNLHAMKEANDSLRKMGSQLQVADNDLTKKLMEAENLGMQMHVKTETERQRQGSSSSIPLRSTGSGQNSQPHHYSGRGSFGNEAKYQKSSMAQQKYSVQNAQLSTTSLQQSTAKEQPHAKESVAGFASSHGGARAIDAVTKQQSFRQDEAAGHRYESSHHQLIQHRGEPLSQVARPHQHDADDTRSSNFARQSEEFRFGSGQQRATVTEQIYRAKQKYELSLLQNIDERNLQDRTSDGSASLQAHALSNQGRLSSSHLQPSQQRQHQQLPNESYYTDSRVEAILPGQVGGMTQQSEWQRQADFSELPRQLNPPESHSHIQVPQAQQQAQGSQISLAQQLLSQQASQQHAFPQEGPQYGTDQDQQRSQNITQFSSSQKEQRAYFMSQAQNLQPQNQQGGSLNYAYQQNDAKNGFDRW